MIMFAKSAVLFPMPIFPDEAQQKDYPSEQKSLACRGRRSQVCICRVHVLICTSYPSFLLSRNHLKGKIYYLAVTLHLKSLSNDYYNRGGKGTMKVTCTEPPSCCVLAETRSGLLGYRMAVLLDGIRTLGSLSQALRLQG